MINGILLKNYYKNKDIEMFELTDNNIIICENYIAKQKFEDIMLSFYKASKYDIDTDENIQYCLTDNEDNLEFKRELKFLPTSIYTVVSKDQTKIQRFTVTVEASAIFGMKNIDDVWFCIEKGDIYPLSCFERIEEIWNSGGILSIYKAFVSGRYGCYTGEYLKPYKYFEV